MVSRRENPQEEHWIEYVAGSCHHISATATVCGLSICSQWSGKLGSGSESEGAT